MRKTYLFAPGPTPVPERVLARMSESKIHHRTPIFSTIFKRVIDGLKPLFGTSNTPLVFASSGTGAMEGAVANFLSRSSRALVVVGGKFGQRWSQILSAYGIEHETIDVEWGHAVDPDDVRQRLKSKNFDALFMQACETSTATRHPIEVIGRIIKEEFPDILFVVDGITSVGVERMEADNWGVDILVAGSQKAFMLPPGLSMASVSEKAWRYNERSDLPRYYFDWAKERKSIEEKGQSAYTPAVSLILGLDEVLLMLKEEGLDNVFKRHKKLATATRVAGEKIGLRLLSNSPADGVSAFVVPEGIDGTDVVKGMRKRGFIIAGGQERLKGKIFRISHMGYVNEYDMLCVLFALEQTLQELGFTVEPGDATGAFSNAFMKNL